MGVNGLSLTFVAWVCAAGWLGKTYALRQALEASRGGWVLTIDADMLLERQAVRVAVGRALADFAAVRADIIEDIRLAGLLKRSGARYRVEHAPNLVRTRMQNGFRDIWSFLTRTMFAAMRYSHALGLVYASVGYAFVAARTLSVWAIQAAALAFICGNARIPVAYALTTPLGLALFYTAPLASMSDMLRGKGLGWKERRVYRRAGTGPPRRANPDGR